MTPRRPKRPAPLTWADARCEATATGWHFVLPVPERTNAIWRQHAGRTLISAKHRADKQAAPRRFGCEPLRGDVAVRMVWVRARRSGDVDSRVKATLDLLNNVAWLDDAQITELHVIRLDDDTQPARVEVFVWPADEPVLVP
jgi:Holliday junction resolvase RusA-like endonuclease